MNEYVQQWRREVGNFGWFLWVWWSYEGHKVEQKAETGNKVESRKSYSETNSQLVREIKRLRRINLLTKKRISFQNIAEEFDTLGYEAKKGGRHCKQVQM